MALSSQPDLPDPAEPRPDSTGPDSTGPDSTGLESTGPEPTNDVERSTVLPCEPEQALRALEDPELLSAWLGPWTDEGGGTARVVTDDGRERRVVDHRTDPDGSVRWRWNPTDRPDEISDVVITVAPGRDGTALTVREIVRSARPVAGDDAQLMQRSSVRWTGCLLALGALLAARPALV